MKTVHSESRKPVAQEDGLGCAVASTAFVINIPYQETLALFIDGKRRVQGIPNFYFPEIVEILKKKGLDYSWKELTNKNQGLLEKDLAIVFCEQSSKLPFGHFLVRYQNKWMDPWLNLPEPQIVSGFRNDLPGKASYVASPK